MLMFEYLEHVGDGNYRMPSKNGIVEVVAVLYILEFDSLDLPSFVQLRVLLAK